MLRSTKMINLTLIELFIIHLSGILYIVSCFFYITDALGVKDDQTRNSILYSILSQSSACNGPLPLLIWSLILYYFL